jgi:hypothetical protein
MKTERLFNVILLELSSEKMKIEDDLERIMNSDTDIEFKTTQIKALVVKLNTVEASIIKFNDMISNNNKTII